MELAGQHRPYGNQHHAEDAYGSTPQVYITYIIYIGAPLLDEVGGYLCHLHAQQVLDLCGEDGDSDTAGETDHDGVGDVLDDGAQTEHAQHDKEHTGHQRGHGQSLHAVLLDDAIDDDDEGSRGTANLHFAASEEGDEQTGHNGGDDALLG